MKHSLLTTKPALYFKSLLFYILIAALTLIGTLLVYLGIFLPTSYKLAINRYWAYGILQIGKYLCGMKYVIHGKENLPQEPVVFLAKHQSAWETLTFSYLLPLNCFVFKKELLNIPVLGWGMRLCKHIPINRAATMQAYKKVLMIGKERINEGLSIVIFPEGTRALPHEHLPFHKSGVALAKAAGVPVVPIAHNSGVCWLRKSFIKKPGTITIIIGKPVATENRSTDEINKECYEWMKAAMAGIEA